MSNYNSSAESMTAIFNLGSLTQARLLFASSSGMLKQVEGSEFDVAKRTTAATKLNAGDTLLFVGAVTGSETIVLQTEKGMFLRFPASDVPEKKKGAVGVRGIKLAEKDAVEGVYLLGEQEEHTITYKDKEIALHRLRIGNRDAKGVKK